MTLDSKFYSRLLVTERIRDIGQYYYVLYMIPYCYDNYYVSIGDPTVHLTTL